MFRGFECRVVHARAHGGCSEQLEKLLDRELRLFEDVRKRRPFDWPIRRDDDLQRFLIDMLMQADVAAVVQHDDPAAALECADDTVLGQIPGFCQTTISTNSA